MVSKLSLSLKPETPAMASSASPSSSWTLTSPSLALVCCNGANCDQVLVRGSHLSTSPRYLWSLQPPTAYSLPLCPVRARPALGWSMGGRGYHALLTSSNTSTDDRNLRHENDEGLKREMELTDESWDYIPRPQTACHPWRWPPACSGACPCWTSLPRRCPRTCPGGSSTPPQPLLLPWSCSTLPHCTHCHQTAHGNHLPAQQVFWEAKKLECLNVVTFWLRNSPINHI